MISGQLPILFQSSFKEELSDIERLGGGKNSKVYKLTGDQGKTCVAKEYYAHKNDQRDRIGVEFNSFSFLWENGLRNIPKPLVTDKKEGISLFSFIDGEKLDTSLISEKSIDDAIDLLISLDKLKNLKEAHQFQPASEAFFDLKGIIENIENRKKRLCDVPSNAICGKELDIFLTKRMIPLFESTVKESIARLQKIGVSVEEKLPFEHRTLSPSDFGFHNAIKSVDGRLFFFDFEYFGWDDPVKMISDFILHPGMKLKDDKKKYFFTKLFNHFNTTDTFSDRFKALYPLFSIKWSLILLNEFLPEGLGRREFASTKDMEIAHVRMRQLKKAENILNEVHKSYE